MLIHRKPLTPLSREVFNTSLLADLIHQTDVISNHPEDWSLTCPWGSSDKVD